jgi:hypothetical protein
MATSTATQRTETGVAELIRPTAVADLFLGRGKLTGVTRVLDEYAMEHRTLELLDSLGEPRVNVYHVADRIVVLRLGRLAASFDRHTTPREEVVAAITGAGATPAP